MLLLGFSLFADPACKEAQAPCATIDQISQADEINSPSIGTPWSIGIYLHVQNDATLQGAFVLAMPDSYIMRRSICRAGEEQRRVSAWTFFEVASNRAFHVSLEGLENYACNLGSRPARGFVLSGTKSGPICSGQLIPDTTLRFFSY